MNTYLVSYADTDAGGVLHHAKYLELAETGRHWWLKRRELSFSRLNTDHGVSLVVHAIAAKYQAAIFLEDELEVKTFLRNIDRSGVEWQTRISSRNTLCCAVTTKMVCVHASNKTIMAVPDYLIAKLTAEVESD